MIARYDWIIGICSSGTDGVKLLRFVGTKEEIKTKLMQLILEDKANDEENWDFGCESANDIRDEYNGLGYEFYGYGCYHDYHIDYTAKEFAHIDMI